MWAIAVFDVLLAANLAAGILSSRSSQIQFGEHLTIPSGAGLAIMLGLFVAGPLASAAWSARRAAA